MRIDPAVKAIATLLLILAAISSLGSAIDPAANLTGDVSNVSESVNVITGCYGSGCPGTIGYITAIESSDPPHSSSVAVAPGKSVDMRVVVKDVSLPSLAGSSLYLRYDPNVISDISCVSSGYKEHSSCLLKEPGRFLIEGYDTFPDNQGYTGDVVVAVVRLTASPNAQIGDSTSLVLERAPTGEALGSPIWGPGWTELVAIFEQGTLTVEQECEPQIEVTKVGVPEQASPTAEVQFTITVSNPGDCSLDQVVAVDTLPDGMTYVSSSPQGAVEGQKITWNLEPMAPGGAPQVVVLNARIDEGAKGVLTNEVAVTAASEEEEDVSASASFDIKVLIPSISVEKVADVDRAAEGMHIEYKITVKNTGDTALADVWVEDRLPKTLQYCNWGTTPPTQRLGNNIRWYLGTLEAGSDPVEITLGAHPRQTADMEIVNTVRVWGKPPSGQKVSSSATSTLPVIHPAIKVTKTAESEVLYPLEETNFRIDVKNTGDCALDALWVEDFLPPGLIYLWDDVGPYDIWVDEDYGTYIMWDNLGPLDPGETATINVHAGVDMWARGRLETQAFAVGLLLFQQEDWWYYLYGIYDWDVATVRVKNSLIPAKEAKAAKNAWTVADMASMMQSDIQKAVSERYNASMTLVGDNSTSVISEVNSTKADRCPGLSEGMTS